MILPWREKEEERLPVESPVEWQNAVPTTFGQKGGNRGGTVPPASRQEMGVDGWGQGWTMKGKVDKERRERM